MTIHSMDDLGMITFKKSPSPLDHRKNLVLSKSENKSSSLPDIQVLDAVDSNPSHIGQPQSPVNPISNKEENDVFNFTYYGSINIDKRTIPSVFPWIAKRIIKHSNNPRDIYANISKSKLWLTERANFSLCFEEHPFDSIYRLSRMTKNHMEDFLAYIISSKTGGSNATFHLLKCNDQNEVSN